MTSMIPVRIYLRNNNPDQDPWVDKGWAVMPQAPQVGDTFQFVGYKPYEVLSRAWVQRALPSDESVLAKVRAAADATEVWVCVLNCGML